MHGCASYLTGCWGLEAFNNFPPSSPQSPRQSFLFLLLRMEELVWLIFAPSNLYQILVIIILIWPLNEVSPHLITSSICFHTMIHVRTRKR